MIIRRLETVWAPRVLSVLRIVAALLFMEHGTQKLLAFPPSPNPGPALLSLSGIAGVFELFGWRSARRGPVHAAGSLHSLRRDGNWVLDGARAA
jgi:uncharacterized membrane protein YphA (DoxX/SURF4 family)